jgi:transketolase
MRHNPSSPEWPDRDRFILSAGHACVLQYSVLHLTGYNLSLEELKRFRQWESITPGHPEHFLTPGIETTTGPLGQGFANGVGMAIAERFLADRFNRPKHEIVDHRIYCICSDGDMMEGLSNEAASIAGQFGLGKLVYFYDDNRITIDGTTSISFSAEDRGRRLEAQGWHVQHVDDVEDLDALRAAIRAAQDEVERPSMIVVRSHIAYPSPHAVDTSASHGAPLGAAEVGATKQVMGFDPDATFAVDPAVYDHMSQVARGIEAEQAWRDRFEVWSASFPAVREEWDRAWSGKPLPGWAEALPEWKAGESLATRDAGKAVMQAFKPFTPTMIGGAADLVEST